jgi:hypothetical protein
MSEDTMLSSTRRTLRWLNVLLVLTLILPPPYVFASSIPPSTYPSAMEESAADVGSEPKSVGADEVAALSESPAVPTAVLRYLPVTLKSSLHPQPTDSTALYDEAELTDASSLVATLKQTPAPPPPPSSETVTVTLDSRGGAVTSPDARFRLDFPAGALNRTAAIVATAVRPETDGEGRITFVRFDLNAYALDAQGRPAERITRFALPYTLTVNLSGVFDLAGPDRHIRLKYLDEAQGEWVDLPLVAVDRENHRLVARIDHFSSFGGGRDQRILETAVQRREGRVIQRRGVV